MNTMLRTRRRNAPDRTAMFRRFVNQKTFDSTARFTTIAQEAGMRVATLATAWPLTHDFVGSTIIGATAVDQITDTLAAVDVTLSADVLKACHQVTKDLLYPMG